MPSGSNECRYFFEIRASGPFLVFWYLLLPQANKAKKEGHPRESHGANLFGDLQQKESLLDCDVCNPADETLPTT